MEEVLLKVTPRVSQTSAGTDRVRRRANVMVGDRAGDIGFGEKTKRTETLAVMGATGTAYRKRFHIVLGSWDLQNLHTVPFYVIGFHAGIRVHIKPAPEGTGIHSPSPGAQITPLARKILNTAGVKDCLLRIEGICNSSTDLKLIQAFIHAFMKLNASRFWRNMYSSEFSLETNRFFKYKKQT